jgi:hypothetical protein
MKHMLHDTVSIASRSTGVRKNGADCARAAVATDPNPHGTDVVAPNGLMVAEDRFGQHLERFLRLPSRVNPVRSRVGRTHLQPGGRELGLLLGVGFGLTCTAQRQNE